MSFLVDFRPIPDEPRRLFAFRGREGRGMSPDDHPDRLSFLGRPLSQAFEIRVVTVSPGATRVYRDAEWRDALVVVERGRIQLEVVGGGGRDFATGDVLCLVGLSLRALHNRWLEPTVLVAVSRKR